MNSFKKLINKSQFHETLILSKILFMLTSTLTLLLVFLRDRIVKFYINLLNPMSNIPIKLNSNNHSFINNELDKKEIIDLTDYEKENISLKKKSIFLGYEILLNTMCEYIDQYPESPQFEHFLQIMWPTDYDILVKSKQKIDGFSRDYRDWEDIFNLMIPDY